MFFLVGKGFGIYDCNGVGAFFLGWEMLWLELLDGFFVVMGIRKCCRFT